ncbi:hypothetical protein T459_29634 [Capsicum annuum]|uniref:TIR domain-containing protein n=1 Tax=Capsicum annuum TaxID=4072 RepID=A0A2G2Y691_CAPAN|nr:hypothetical protein T459_29634 [Capsicum annuum]
MAKNVNKAWSHCNSRVWLRVKGLKLRILVSPLAAHFKLSAAQSPQSEEEEWYMAQVPYSSIVSSIMYAMVVKWILKYLRGTSNACLEFGRNTNTSVGFVDSDYESRIAIIIFSKNYASSRWCLDELTKIMECVDNNGTTVFPESRIAIIIFSKNYASSRWCLDELTKIMECVDNNGTTVFPVFLDIDHRMYASKEIVLLMRLPNTRIRLM